MKLKIFSFITILMILSFPITGCAQMMGGPLVEIMKILPDDTKTLWSIDIKQFESDSDLEDLYDDFRDEIDEDDMEEAIGVSLPDLSTLIVAKSDNSQWVIFKGEFDLDDVRFSLEDQHLKEDEYRDVEVWRGDYAVTFLGDMIIVAERFDDIKIPIRLNERKGGSMYDDEYFKSIAERLPSGIINLLTKESGFGAQANGITVNKLAMAKDSMEVRGWYKFSSEKRAESSISALEDQLEQQLDAIRIDCRQDGEFVEVTGEVDIDDFTESSFWRNFGLR